MATARTRTIIAQRPAALPAPFWTIHNAPRPIYGHVTWNGEFVSGLFYAAILTDQADAARLTELNRQQDAVILTYASEEELFAAGYARILAENPGVEETLDDPRSRNWIVNSQLDHVNFDRSKVNL